jgi:hypothetical protein
MTDLRPLDELLRAQEGDAGCDAGIPIMDQYVEIELSGQDPAERFPGKAIHLRVCPACRADHDGSSWPPGTSATSVRTSAVRRDGNAGTHLTDGAEPRAPDPERSETVTRHQDSSLQRLVRRLRPAAESFAAAAAEYDSAWLLHLRAPQRRRP